ncbi:MAG: hypothetical protein ABI600_01370 [Luteolibacter sp.]
MKLKHRNAASVIFLTLSWQSAGAQTAATWNGSSGSWSDSARWSSNPQVPQNGSPNPGSTYAVSIYGGTVTRNSVFTVTDLYLSGGTVNGSSALNVQDSMTWAGGSIDTGSLNSNGSLSITGSAVLYGTSAILTQASGHNATISGSGSLAMENQSKFVNNGTFLARNNLQISEVGSYQSNFTNNGTFTRDTGTGTFTLGITQFSNNGTINVNSGTLEILHGIENAGPVQIAGGSILKISSASNWNSGTAFSGPGNLLLSDDEQNFHTNLTLAAGLTLASSAQLTIHDGHTFTANGSFTWSGGTLARESDFLGGLHGYFTANNGITISGSADFYGVTLTNAATSTATLTGSLAFKNGNAIFQNSGSFIAQSGSSLDLVSGTGHSFNNSGTFTANSSAFNNVEANVPFNNSGTVSCSGGTLQFTKGGTSSGNFVASAGTDVEWTTDYAFNDGTTFTGDGRFSVLAGTQTLESSISTSSEVDIYSTLSLSPGIAFTNNGFLFFSGNLSGGGSLRANDTMRLGGGAINGSVLINGTGSVAEHLDVFFGNSFTLNNGGVLQNNGTFIAKDGLGFINGSGSGNFFINAGTLTRNTSSGNYTIGTLFSNTGTVNANTGSLVIAGGGTSTGATYHLASSGKIEFSKNYTFGNGNSADGTGLLVFGTDAATEPLAIHTFTGTTTAACPVKLGNATLSLAPAAVFTSTGTLDAALGTLTGGGLFNANGATTIGNLSVNGATLALGAAANLVHISAETLVLSNGGMLNNAGNFLAKGDHDYVGTGAAGIEAGAGTGNIFNNSGAFTRDTGSGVYAVSVPFNNSGTVSSQSGTLIFDHGGSSTGGTWDASGGLLQLVGDFTFNGTTAMTGAGTVQLGAGTHTINGPVNATSGLAIYGPAILAVQPTQTVTVTGVLSLLPGGVAPLTVPPVISGGGTVQADGSSELFAATVDGATLSIGTTGTITHHDALPLTLSNTGVIINAGTYLATGEASIVQDPALTNLFHNPGIFTRNTSPGIFTVAVPFDNTGNVNVETGTLSFTKSVTATAGVFNTGIGAILNFTADNSFDSATVFTGPGNVQLAGGIQTIALSTVSDSPISLSLGALDILPSVVFDSNGALDWTGGAISGGGTFNANGGVSITGDVSLINSTFNLPSGQTATQILAGHLLFKDAAVFNNAGTYRASNDNSMEIGTGTGQLFSNSGIFVRDIGTGNFQVGVPFYNNGLVDVLTGTLSFNNTGESNGGTYHVETDTDLSFNNNSTLVGATHFTGGGRVNFIAGTQAVTDTADSTAIVNLSGGGISIALDQSFDNNGDFHWSGGQITGGGTLQNATTLNVIGPSVVLDGAIMLTTATGVSSIETDGSMSLKNSGLVKNEGIFFLLNDSSMNAGDATAVGFENSGVVSRDTGTGVFYINVPFNHSGLVNVNSGGLAINGGGTSLNGTFHTATGTDLSIGTNYTFDTNNFITGTGSVSFASGILHVTGSLTSDASFNWSGGSLDGGGTFTVKGGMTIAPGPTGAHIIGSTLENATGSEAIISGSGPIYLEGGGSFHNSGTARLQGNTGFVDNGGSGNTISNSGTMIRDATSGNYTITLPINNTGTIRSNSGALLLNNGGSSGSEIGSLDADGGDIYLNGSNFNFSGGAITGSSFIYASAGLVTVSGDTGATSGPATGGFGLAGATFGGNSMLSVDRGYLSTGTMTETAVLRFTGVSTKADNSNLAMQGGTIRNDGTLTQGYQANFDLDTSSTEGGGTIQNNGIWNITNDCNFSNTYGGGQINNSGTFNQSGGYNSIFAAFNNSAGGVLNASAQYILLRGGGTQAVGSILNADGGDIHFYGGTHTLNGGTFTGSLFTYASVGTVNVMGNVGASSGPATGGFGLNGAVLGGTAMISADHGYLNTGTMTDSVVVRFTGESTKENNSILTMQGGTIRNDGTFTQGYQANYELDSNSAAGGGTIQNNGTWNLTRDCYFSNTYGDGVFNNVGTLNQAGGYNNLFATFHNPAGGVLNATANYILLRGGGTQALGSILNADGGDIHFYGGTHTLNGCTLTGSSSIYASLGNVNVIGDVGASSGPATGGFGINGAVLGGTAMISADHGYLNTGTVIDSVVVRFTGLSTKESNSYLAMQGGTIRNDGTLTQGYQSNYELDSSSAAGGGTIQNNGTWNLTRDCYFYNTYGNGVFNNVGTLNQAGGYNNLFPAFHNSAGGVLNASAQYIFLRGGGTQAAGSILNADGGDIHFYGGTHTLNGCTLSGSSSVYASSGNVNVMADVGASTGPATGGFGINGSVVGGTAMISSDHGYLNIGTVIDSVVVRFTGTSTKEDNSYLAMQGGTIRNDGTFNQSYQANYELDQNSAAGGGTIQNNGTWNLNRSSSFHNTYGEGRINNSGIFNQAGGGNAFSASFHNSSTGVLNSTAGYIYLQGGGTQAAGSILNANGGDIYFNGGTHYLNGGTLMGADFTYASSGTVSVDANVGAETGPATGGFGVAGGVVGGTAMISADHGYFSKGTITESPVLRFTGVSSKADNTYLTLQGGTIQNDGTFNQSYQANYDLDSISTPGGGTIQNNGTWNLNLTSSFYNSNGGGRINNSGTFNQGGGGNAFSAPFNNSSSGVLNSTAGYIYLQGGGTQAAGSILNANGGSIYFNGGTHFLNGGSLTGADFTYASAGTVSVDANVGAESGPATGGFGIAGGVVGGTAMISADHGYFSTGTITESPVLRFTGVSSKADNTYLTLQGGTIQNDGTFNQSYQANYDLDSISSPGGGTIQNNGTWNLNNSSGFYNSYGEGRINNAGNFNQLGGTNDIRTPIINSGTITATSGVLILRADTVHSGSLITNSLIILASGTHNMAGSLAHLGGSGTLSGDITISDGAKISPGNSPGTLTLDGTVSFVSGGANPAYQVELAGPASFDQISLPAGAVLDLGTNLTNVQISLLYAPAYGDTFRVISSSGSGHFTGSFANMPGTSSVVTASYGGQSYSFGITYGGNGKTVDLTVLTPYLAWAYSNGLRGADADFNSDPDADGIANGVEFVIGGEPNPSNSGSNSTDLLPVITLDETYLRVIYRRNDAALYLAPGIEYDADLGGLWTTALQGVNGVSISIMNDGFGDNIDHVEVLIPRANEVDGKLFAHLKVSQP